ncbi:DUF4976 domain-containing protein [Pigmentiphaga sp. H8]|uniref:sulfatase family protein n=1 Tax=Pigmentiphaga sp. H8 TaxID=2488560 RepID=UPI000F596EBD|nr:sulfatase-like hydrolase/transferase [Pigmentiphaga sp. H8]AZG11227.1 DUF4976 domain-containing protein [Pigmentiphaga sp. H8]
MTAARPNFLIFITDQHRANHLGCYGNPIVRTPHIDQLAGDGMRFERAYVANPVCMPNRSSMLTGRMPSVHGVRGNGIPLPLETVTFADLLAESGYRTALIGKSHFQPLEDHPSMLPPPVPEPGISSPSASLAEARRGTVDPALYRQELRSSWENPDHRLRLPYYGFQEVVYCNNHADECFGDYLRWLQREHPEAAARMGREHGLRDPRYVAPQAWRTHLDEEAYPTHYVASQTTAWLERHARQRPGQPFALVCSFPDPHHPWTPPGRYWDMYDPAAMPLPESMAHADQPRHVRWLREERQRGQAALDGPRLFAASEREVREMIALTYGMITNVDDRIGMVMQTLRAVGADENTVVVFTSDHGDLMGDHGIMLKGPLHYQGLVRVPLIWREPGGAPARQSCTRDDLASAIDLPASILQRAGIMPPNGSQGRPLVTRQGAPRASGRDAVLIEENQQRAFLGFDQPVKVRTVVTSSHRMSVFAEGDWGELYDLERDPHELRNLWDQPEACALKLELMTRLVKLQIEHAETSPRPAHRA